MSLLSGINLAPGRQSAKKERKKEMDHYCQFFLAPL